jgi:hypothetical protein
VPTDEDLFGPGRYFREKPVCPSNGTYAIFAVDTEPTCTLLGHIAR